MGTKTTRKASSETTTTTTAKTSVNRALGWQWFPYALTYISLLLATVMMLTISSQLKTNQDSIRAHEAAIDKNQAILEHSIIIQCREIVANYQWHVATTKINTSLLAVERLVSPAKAANHFKQLIKADTTYMNLVAGLGKSLNCGL